MTASSSASPTGRMLQFSAWAARRMAAVPRRFERLSAQQQARWIWGFLLLGIAVRTVRYLVRFPLWNDEVGWRLTFLDHGYLDLMRPLDRCQVPRSCFVEIAVTIIKVLGFSEYTVRLFPFRVQPGQPGAVRHLRPAALQGDGRGDGGGHFCGEQSLHPLCGGIQTLRLGPAGFAAVGDAGSPVVAVAGREPLVVGTDGPHAAGRGALVLGRLRGRRSQSLRGRRAVAFGFPPRLAAWIAYNVVLIAAFGCFFILCAKHQADQHLGAMLGVWADAFPPSHSVGEFLVWFTRAHTGAIFAQPVGGENFGSTGTFLLCAAAVALWCRRRRYPMVLLCTLPFVLNFLAAAIHCYPYGGDIRLAMHLTPLVCLMAGFGAGCSGPAPGNPAGRSGHRVACLGRLRHPGADQAGLDRPRPSFSGARCGGTAKPRFRQLVLGGLGSRPRASLREDRFRQGVSARRHPVAVLRLRVVPVQPADLLAASRPGRTAAAGPGFALSAASLRPVLAA